MPELKAPLPFTELMARAQCSDQQAIQALIDEYGDVVLRVVQRRLGTGERPALRRLFDPADFVQEVWADFFAKGIHTGTFNDAKELVAYLLRMAANKVATAERDHLLCQKRSLLHQQSLENRTLQMAEQLTGHDLSPEQSAIVQEELERVEKQHPCLETQVLNLLRLGMSQHQVAERLATNDRTVQPIFAKHRSEMDRDE